MVVGAFPLGKLALLAIKHISKPIGNLIKRTAQKNPSFKTVVVSPPARLYHVIDVRSRMWMLGLGQPRFIPPLNEAMTIQMGGDILGEMVIFIIGASLVIAEFSRQSRNDKIKHEKHKVHREKLEERIGELNDKVSRQAKEISHLKSMVVGRRVNNFKHSDSRDLECN
ncbi:putative OPA3-like protein CG13603 isoform X1 [Drosophila biarmipes]|uniref:putative OPA3-like protein CG13603 isoform X1 n=1 Tax=Drosophila biarmipes TaxID=125945 RepID=UPI0007E6DC64|nr:putative OPA3-like protein CG13603 isoform X1 [Drosophila biarmipes]